MEKNRGVKMLDPDKDPETGGENTEPTDPVDPTPDEPDEPEKPTCICGQVDDDEFKAWLDSIFDGTDPPEPDEDEEPCPCDCHVSDEAVEEMIKEVFDEPEPPPEEPPDDPPDDPPEEPPACKPPPSTIMNDVKKFCGVFADYDVFDLDFMMNINAAFFTLFELGVGPKGGFAIEDDTTEWSAFMEGVDVDEDRVKMVLSAVKQYVFLKVRQTFDPPSSSYVLNNVAAQIAELEWRLRELCAGWLDEEKEDDEPCECDPPSEEPPPEEPPSDEPGEECSCPYETATDEEVEAVIEEVFGESKEELPAEPIEPNEPSE